MRLRVSFEEHVNMLQHGERTWFSPVPGLFFGYCPMPMCGQWKPLLKYVLVPETGNVIQGADDEPLFCKECANSARYIGGRMTEDKIVAAEEELADSEDAIASVSSMLVLMRVGMTLEEASEILGFKSS